MLPQQVGQNRKIEVLFAPPVGGSGDGGSRRETGGVVTGVRQMQALKEVSKLRKQGSALCHRDVKLFDVEQILQSKGNT